MQVPASGDDGTVLERGAEGAELEGAADGGPIEGGEVVYDWDMASDVIRWGPNLAATVGIGDAAALATGLAYAERLAVDSPSSRYEAIVGSGGYDTGGGVPFRAV